MKLLKALIPAWLVMGAYAAFCLWARTRLPDAPIATHFDGNMHAIGWMPRDKALFTPLTVYAVIMAGATAMPLFAPARRVLERSARGYGAVCLAVSVLCAVVLGSLIAKPLGWPVDMGATIAVTLGVVLMVIGNFATKVRPNPYYGIRTPWTLSNETVWDKTHRFGGPALMAGGLFILVADLVWPMQFAPILAIGVLVPSLSAVAYSYWLWRRLPPEDQRRIRIDA